MATINFFDDSKLYNRVGFERKQGEPKRIYNFNIPLPDERFSFQWPTGLWREEDGTYRMTAQFMSEAATSPDVTLMYYSHDGLNWIEDNRAEEMGVKNVLLPNQCFDYDLGYEVGFVFYDRNDVPERRLKALVNIFHRKELYLDDIIFSSPDGFRWTKMEGASWNVRGAEPGLSCFYNPQTKKNSIICRPTWGDRRLCISHTDTFDSASYPELLLQPDSEEVPLAEYYGMQAFPYKDYFVGFLWLYNTVNANANKFWEGKINTRLTYSRNGIHWMHGLRKPFIDNGPEGSDTAGMVYITTPLVADDGEIRIFGGAFPLEHGHFKNPNGTPICHILREDGFTFIEAKENGAVYTRPLILDGEIDVNINAVGATCAIYMHNGKALEGFSHDDCVAFSGDCTHWKPTWKNADISTLCGKAVCLEIKLESGKLYAVNGSFKTLTAQEARRYDAFGFLLENTGF